MDNTPIRHSKAVRAFTLIELLIVIAIIAILALIAVPNFLEAQVRAKVSRTNADMRSCASAIEAYAVDWGRSHIGQREASANKADFYPGSSTALIREITWALLTTPVAYITTIPLDVFTVMGGNENAALEFFRFETTYRYTDSGGTVKEQSNFFRRARAQGFLWAMGSEGPSKVHQVPGIVDVIATSYMENVYDSTNGTMSLGKIIRTNQGAYPAR